MKHVCDGTVDSQKSRRGRLKRVLSSEEKRPVDREYQLSTEKLVKKCVNAVRMCIWVYEIKVDFEALKSNMEIASQGQSVTGPVDVGATDQVRNADVKHIEDFMGGRL